MVRKPIRKEISFYSENAVDYEVLRQLENMADRGGMSVPEIIKKIVIVFTPAAAMSDYIDVARLQQNAIAALVNGTHQPVVTPQPQQPAISNNGHFEAIQGF